MGFRTTGTTPATKWKSYLLADMPVDFEPGEEPKAILTNITQNITLVDETGNSVVFIPAIGVPIQVRPRQINTISGASIIALFD